MNDIEDVAKCLLEMSNEMYDIIGSLKVQIEVIGDILSYLSDIEED